MQIGSLLRKSALVIATTRLKLNPVVSLKKIKKFFTRIGVSTKYSVLYIESHI
jgi:hypothetical protein